MEYANLADLERQALSISAGPAYDSLIQYVLSSTLTGDIGQRRRYVLRVAQCGRGTRVVSIGIGNRNADREMTQLVQSQET